MSQYLQSFHAESVNRIKDIGFLNISLNQKYYAQLLLDVTRVHLAENVSLVKKMQKISTFVVDLQTQLVCKIDCDWKIGTTQAPSVVKMAENSYRGDLSGDFS